ncbi:conserved hypothetical protein [Hahella chejuensis KCTC 2396]|uniref:Serine kinase of the HPr protein, regulates carbohydrate metabolism n=1 Tax=Hahella chejuensis (strain KCTC 2396) TaxID=349521 RepID=Q2S9H3_HAHCH|nr:hypothetical protein [Hahella chejuensis]ABB69096.1 hypothetical protein [Hahella chejuensis KCTC 2396]ABC32701.1 conserved hypothetical protein [Hahella chejuensis KCTC 2396]
MYNYQAYGLQIQAEFEFPWLVRGGDGSDLTIVIGETPGRLERALKQGKRYQATESEALIFDDDGGRFWVRPSRIVITPGESSQSWSIYAHVLGSCMGAILQWRKRLVLHASAVRLPSGGALLFCGNKTAGKSSMAGLFYYQGCDLLSDDICPLSLEGSEVSLCPGFPRLKLSSEILLTMGETPENHPRLPFKTRVKHCYPASRNFSLKKAFVQSVYILTEGRELSLQKLTPQEAIAGLFEHCFRKVFLVSLEQRKMMLNACATLAGVTSVYSLQRPKLMSEAISIVDMLAARELEASTA